MPPIEPLPPNLTERQFQTRVIDYARSLGYLVAHFRAARMADGRWRTPVEGDGAGFPDLLIAGYGLVLAWELKSRRGKVTPEQQAWGERLLAAGVTWCVLRPRDWPLIQTTLAGWRESALSACPERRTDSPRT